MKLPAAFSRDQRVLIGGATTIALILTLGRGLPAWQRWFAGHRASVTMLTHAAARAQASVAATGATRDSLAARRRRFQALTPSIVEGTTPSMAGAKLAAMLASVAAESSVRLGPVQVRSDTAGPSVFTRVGVRAELTGDVRGITELLSTLERGPTLLAIRDLSISQPDPAAPNDHAEALRVELTLEGLALTPRGPHGSDSTRSPR